MNPGNRFLHLLLFACVGTLAAAHAGRIDEDGTGAVWVAPELLAALEASPFSACMHDVVIDPAHMQANGRVTFEWHPDTGELSFADDPSVPVTRPEAPALEPSPLAMQSCESR